MTVGVVLGLLNGVLSAVVFLFFIRQLSTTNSTAQELKIVAEILAIPTFWFGGPWVAAKILEGVDWNAQTEPYAVALAAMFGIIVVVPVFQYVRKITAAIAA